MALIDQLIRNPYHCALPIYGMRRDGNALTATTFAVRGKDGAPHLLIAAHLAANRSPNLEGDRADWFSELWFRTSPEAEWLRLALFDDAELHEIPRFNCAFDGGGLLDAISIKIPTRIESHFAGVNITAIQNVRAPRDCEDVIFWGFPLVGTRWPSPVATPGSGQIAAGHLVALREGNHEFDGGFSGSAVFAAATATGQPHDLVGMIIGGEGEQGVIMPGDLIASIVNGEPLPRNSPAHVRDGMLRVNE